MPYGLPSEVLAYMNLPGMTQPGGASAGTVPGTPPRGYSPAYGGVPTVPDPLASTTAAIGGNIGNLAQLYQLAIGGGGASAAGARTQLEANLPGYSGLIGQSSANIGSMLRGQVPLDVSRAIGQGAAERGVATGMAPGGQSTNAALLRALGLTSLGMQQTGEQELTAAIGRTPTGPTFDPARFFMTPEQLQQARTAASLYASAPNPAAAAAEALRVGQLGVGAGMGGVGGGGRVSGAGPMQPSQTGVRGQSLAPDYAGFATHPIDTVSGLGGGDWYAQTFGNQRFGSPAGVGSFYAGQAGQEGQLDYLDQLLGMPGQEMGGGGAPLDFGAGGEFDFGEDLGG